MRNPTKHNGLVLAGVLMLSLAALACALLTLSTANKVFDTLDWQAMLLKEENTAVQAEAIAKSWFADQVEKGTILSNEEFDIAALPKEDPYVKLPDNLFSELSVLNKNIDIRAEIIDQNYSDSFQPDADNMEIPFGSPSEHLLQRDGSSDDILRVKRYCLRVSASFNKRSDRAHVLAKNMLAVKNGEGEVHLISLYTKKQ